jgi:hypothetical protein
MPLASRPSGEVGFHCFQTLNAKDAKDAKENPN